MRHKKTRSQSKKLCDKKKTAVSLFDMNYIDGRRPYAHIIIASEQVECLIILVSLDGCANDNFPYREQFSIVAWLSRYQNHLGQIPSLTKVIPDIHLFFYNAISNAPTSGRGETAFSVDDTFKWSHVTWFRLADRLPSFYLLTVLESSGCTRLWRRRWILPCSCTIAVSTLIFYYVTFACLCDVPIACCQNWGVT